ncbi:MAG: hypothetical protein K1W16_11675 [Lachnospiraceae bacterium]
MRIDTYVNIMKYFFVGLFLLSILTGIVAIWKRIQKKPLKYEWISPLTMIYSIFGLCNTFLAYIAYDDISDPNYSRYENWGLHNFILNDLKMLILWLFISVIVFVIFSRKQCKISNRSENLFIRYIVKTLSIWLLIGIICCFMFLVKL